MNFSRSHFLSELNKMNQTGINESLNESLNESINEDDYANLRRPAKLAGEIWDYIQKNHYSLARSIAKGDRSRKMKKKDWLPIDPEFNNYVRKSGDKKLQSMVSTWWDIDSEEFSKPPAFAYNESVNEASHFYGPFFFTDNSSDDELIAAYKGALDGYAYWSKGYHYPKSDYKKAYQEAEKILKKRKVVYESAIVESVNFILGPSPKGDPHKPYNKPFFIESKKSKDLNRKIKAISNLKVTWLDGEFGDVAKIEGGTKDSLQKLLDTLDDKKDGIQSMGWIDLEESVNEGILQNIKNFFKGKQQPEQDDPLKDEYQDGNLLAKLMDKAGMKGAELSSLGVDAVGIWDRKVKIGEYDHEYAFSISPNDDVIANSKWSNGWPQEFHKTKVGNLKNHPGLIKAFRVMFDKIKADK